MRIIGPALFLLVLTSGSAAAQSATPAAEISGGYSFLRDNAIEENLHGWLLSFAGNLNRTLGIVGEVGGNGKSYDVLGTDVDLNVYSFMAGPRFSARQATVTPYGQVLIGVARASASVLTETESSTELAIQPGGGVDMWVTPNVAVRVGGDYRRVFAEGEGVNEFRFHLGVNIAIGQR